MNRLLQTICDKKRWILLTSLLFVIACGLGTYIFYKQFFHPKDKSIILRQFGTLFHTEEQIAEIHEKTETAKVGPSKEIPTGKGTCSFTCDNRASPYTYNVVSNRLDNGVRVHQSYPDSTEKTAHQNIGRRRGQQGPTKTRRRIQQHNNNNNTPNIAIATTRSTTANTNDTGTTTDDGETKFARVVEDEEVDRNWKHHGCCRSRTRIVKPTSLTTIDGLHVRAVQFQSRQQFYFEEECQQMSTCNGCTCYTEGSHQVFLVVDDNSGDESDGVGRMDDDDLEPARLEMVSVPGCCKCLNGQ